MALAAAETVLDLIGSTPMLRLARLEPPGGAQIWAKLEYLNPGGSVKDRAALGMVLAAEADGRLVPGATIVEPTAGNTGIGLALIGRQRGYRVVLVVPANFSREKMTVMQALGAELVVTPTEEGMPGAIARARAIAHRVPGAVVLQQFENPANPQYHHDVTAREIWEQIGGRADAIVLGAGTGGTWTGVVRYFRERGSRARAVLVEPQGSIWGGGPPGPHRVEGIGGTFWPATLDRALIDEVITVPDDPAMQTARALARECGVLSGGSGGAAVYAAIQVAARYGPEARVITMVPDGAERYLSKGIYDPEDPR
ncbi:MAG TPA: cysteine synthase family protein [Vicinamibacterales bacterium]|nr:cysteine synthase family protein [Vicinamibacterales bacterium]